MNRFEALSAFGSILRGLMYLDDDTFRRICLMEVAQAHIGPAYGYYICDGDRPCIVVPHFTAVVDCVWWHECRTP